MKILIFTIGITLLFSFDYRKRDFFEMENENLTLKPHIIEKKGKYTYFPENAVMPFYIFLSNKVSKILANKELFEIKFGSNFINNEYLYKNGSKIFFLQMDDSSKVKIDYPIFDFSARHDTIDISMGVLQNHKMFLSNISVNNMDSIFEYKFLTFKKNDTTERIDDKNHDVFKSIFISKHHGIIKVIKTTEYYLINYSK